MQNYILYSDVDQQIVDEMAGQAPDVNKRLRAINTELDALQAEYDLFDTVREATISVVTDGSVHYDISTLVTDNDVKSIKDFNLGTDENAGSGKFSYIDLPEFTRKAEGTNTGNYYTLYTKDGIQYLSVITNDFSSTATSLKMLYHTTWKALDTDDDFIPLVVNTAGVQILLPARFKELVALGSIIRLFYPAIGEDALAYLREIQKRYETKKVNLGITVAKTEVKIDRKFSLRKQW